MSEEEKFQHFVDSVRFDDEPSAEHRDRLEEKLLGEYDAAEPVSYEPEPLKIYLRKLAVAAGFLIVCGLTFWMVDTAWLRNPDLTYKPDPQIVKRILEAENPTEAEKQTLMAQINMVWKMIRDRDTQGLVTTVRSGNVAASVRQWAAEHLGQMGDEQTLEKLEESIDEEQVTNPDDPLNIAADDIRQRLEEEK